MTQNASSPNAWTQACNRFTEDLSEDEKRVYFQATPETIFYQASAVDKISYDSSHTRKFLLKLQPFVESIKQYGAALDVISQTYPLLASEAGQYFERISSMFVEIGELLPRLHVYEKLFPTHERLVQALIVIYCDLIHFCSNAKHALRRVKRSSFNRAWKTFDREFGGQIEKFRKHQKFVEKEVTTSHMIESADSRAVVLANQTQVSKEQQAEYRDAGKAFSSTILSGSIEACHSLRIMIDGLDECSDETQSCLSEQVSQWLNVGNSVVKVIVTSREEEKPLRHLRTFANLKFDVSMLQADIEAFISKNKNLKELITSKLSEKAQGMFLWVHFQLQDLCEATSDQTIRIILDHLPNGLHETYVRILEKIEGGKSQANKFLVQQALQWVAFARRPLTVPELQEAVAFDIADDHWDADKIPDGGKLIGLCRGLIIRYQDNRVRFAHHTVRQHLLRPAVRDRSSFSPFEVNPDGLSSPHLMEYYFTNIAAEFHLAVKCAAYLCFSDFESAIVKADEERIVTMRQIFKSGGPIAIPATIGLKRQLFQIPYRFLGGNGNIPMPEIDLSRYDRKINQRARPDMRNKYALLDYVAEYWPWHTKQRLSKTGVELHLPRDVCGEQTIRQFGIGKEIRLDTQIGYIMDHLYHERYHHQTLKVACAHEQSELISYVLTAVTRCVELLPGGTINAKPWSTALALRIRQTPYLIADLTEFCCRSGALEGLVALMDFGEHIDDRQVAKGALLKGAFAAASNGRLQVVKMLLDSDNIDLRAEDATTMTLLHVAARDGHAKVVEEILRRGKQLSNLQNAQGETPLILASQGGHTEVVQLLLEAGAMVLTTGGNLIHLPYKASIDLLLEGLGDCEAIQYPTAIHFAAAKGYHNVLSKLLMSGTVQQENKARGFSQLHSTLIARNNELLKALDPLECAAVYGHESCVNLILNSAPQLNKGLRSGPTAVGSRALHLAATMGHEQVVQLLLQNNTDPDSRILGGMTPLHLAAKTGKTAIIVLLLDPLVSDTSQSAQSPLYERINGRLESFSVQTPLHLAIEGGHDEAVEKLIEYGADPQLECNLSRGRINALQMAIKSPKAGSAIIKAVCVQKMLRSVDGSHTKFSDLGLLKYAIDYGDPVKLQTLFQLGLRDDMGPQQEGRIPTAPFLVEEAIRQLHHTCLEFLLAKRSYGYDSLTVARQFARDRISAKESSSIVRDAAKQAEKILEKKLTEMRSARASAEVRSPSPARASAEVRSPSPPFSALFPCHLIEQEPHSSHD
ncbi:MAG: hypothetical protein OHK93_006321 [Ramalina farinacea]|uniref:Uncharacterized protein n=1 Tax=Ramalina farinacea TaxID=258253 RepID=A0AA43QLT3_9LECA|nr:hypothetical protein [Ramalina farinacea]